MGSIYEDVDHGRNHQKDIRLGIVNSNLIDLVLSAVDWRSYTVVRIAQIDSRTNDSSWVDLANDVHV